MSAETVLLVGGPRGALDAARRMGLEALVLTDGGRARARAPRSGERAIDLATGREAVVAAARALCAGTSGRAPAAVVAVTERSVMPAAWIRAEFALPGLSVPAAERCSNKRAMKRAARAADLLCAEWREIDADSTAEDLVAELGLPLVLKAADASGGRGQIVAQGVGEVRAGLAGRHLAERLVRGREMSVEVFVADGSVVFANPTEYMVPRHANVVPAELEPEDWTAVRASACRAVAAMGIERGMAHVELFLTPLGAVFGELAARPPGGRLMHLLRRAWGFDPWECMLALELGRAVPAIPERPVRCAGSYILHPGPGRVRSIADPEGVRSVPGVKKVALRLAVGDRVAERIGTGQDVGFIDAEGPDRDAVAAALHTAHARLGIELEP